MFPPTITYHSLTFIIIALTLRTLNTLALGDLNSLLKSSGLRPAQPASEDGTKVGRLIRHGSSYKSARPSLMIFTDGP